LIGLAPASDRVVVEIERLGDLLAAPAVVKQKQGVRPSRQALLAMAVAQQRQQFSALARRKKPAANHASSRIRKPFRRKPLFAPSMSPGKSRTLRFPGGYDRPDQHPDMGPKARGDGRSQ